ncbi:MAG TPA: hypothetical protein VHP11_00345 [Tepidisphaeraceae bacterium]|nr:hypothetical protein [Tepidisphaeraceae bacterium]
MSMLNEMDYPAVGRVLRMSDAGVVFQPLGTTYELQLATSEKYAGATGQRVSGVIRTSARKVYTVPSGGNFLVPIAGPTRIVQGRIKALDETRMVVQAGTLIIVELPKNDDAYDLENGVLAVGALVNATIWPGARIEALSAKGQEVVRA